MGDLPDVGDCCRYCDDAAKGTSIPAAGVPGERQSAIRCLYSIAYENIGQAEKCFKVQKNALANRDRKVLSSA
jgi:hypothetical protein